MRTVLNKTTSTPAHKVRPGPDEGSEHALRDVLRSLRRPDRGPVGGLWRPRRDPGDGPVSTLTWAREGMPSAPAAKPGAQGPNREADGAAGPDDTLEHEE